MLTPEQKAALMKDPIFLQQAGLKPKQVTPTAKTDGGVSGSQKLLNYGVQEPSQPSVSVPRTTVASKKDTSFLEKVGKGVEGFVGETVKSAKERTKNIGSGLSELKKGKGVTTTPAEEALNIAGQTIGFGGDVIFNALKQVLPTGVKETAKKAVGKVMETGIAQDTTSIISDWAAKNPRAARNLMNSIEVASVIPAVKGAEVGIQAARASAKRFATQTAKELVPEVKQLGKEFLQETGKKAKQIITGNPEEKAIRAITTTSEDMSKKAYRVAASKGEISPKEGLFKAAKKPITEEEKNIAIKHKDLLQSPDPVKNIVKVVDKQNEIVNKLRPHVEKVSGEMDKNKLAESMYKELKTQKDMNFKDEDIQKMVDDYVSSVESGRDLEVFDRRNDFNTPTTFTGSLTKAKSINQAARRGVRQYLRDSIPGDAYKNMMDDLSDLYTISGKDGVLAAKVSSEKDMNLLRVWMKNNPAKAKLLGWTGATAGGAALLKMSSGW